MNNTKLEGDLMEEMIKIIADNGISIVCVGYLIYFQSTTMKQMLDTLSSINTRLAIIENKITPKG